MINKVRRSTVRSLADSLNVSFSACYRVLTEVLGISKGSVRWVLRLLNIRLLAFKLLGHLPYSPNMAALDFGIFPVAKAVPRGQPFNSVSVIRGATGDVIRYSKECLYKETIA